MEVWATIGFIIIVLIVFMVLMWTLNKAIMAMDLTTSVSGMALLFITGAYWSGVTYLIMSGNVPFMGTSG